MEDEDVFEDAVEEVVAVKKSGKKLPRPISKLSKKIRGKVNNNNDVDNVEETLGDALEEAKASVDLFLNNNYDEAKNIVQPMADRSIYHALGYGVVMFLKAVMTFEQKHIEEASLVLSEACDTINRFRRKAGLAENLGRIVRKADYNAYSELELHAELCYAECLLLKAALTLCEDETLVSFVKAGLKVRTCYQSFRECWTALNERNWGDSVYRSDFESGVRMGVGAFNLMVSLLPARIMKLLEFIGFSGNRDAGLREIMKVYEDKSGLRQFIASFTLLGYHLLLSFFVGSSECDIALCQKIINEKLRDYPDGAFYIFFKGRLHFVQGEMSEAIAWYSRSVSSQNDWPQFHHVCYWELYWASMFSCRWSKAVKYADLLLQDSKWSKCMYAYLKAAAMCMMQGELTEEERQQQIQLMSEVPLLKQRIAGKSLPMEKYAVRKAQRFLEQGNNLALPAIELIYVWNGFKILGQKFQLVEPLYVLVEKTEKRLKKYKDSLPYYAEDLCLVNLLKGVCLKYMKSPLQAEECFKLVVSYGGKLKADTYLVPYALFEYAILLREQGNSDLAMEMLESAKNEYKDYSLQSRLHFRIHAAQTEMKKEKRSAKKGKKKPDSEDASPSTNSSSSFQEDFTVDEMLPEAGMKSTKHEDSITEEDALRLIQGR